MSAAAKPGEVCYSHKHCRLWDSDTHCDFLIPDLFGHCQCTAPMRRDGQVCRPDNRVRPPAPPPIPPIPQTSMIVHDTVDTATESPLQSQSSNDSEEDNDSGI